MHLLSAQPGGFSDETGIIDLAQTPGDVVILAAQDTTLSLLAKTAEQLPNEFPSIRLANLMHLAKPAAFDLYMNSVLQHSRMIVLYLLGGQSYWAYGIECLLQLQQEQSVKLALLPGDDHVDSELFEVANLEAVHAHLLWRYLREGGEQNATHFFHYIGHLLGLTTVFEAPRLLPTAILYHPLYTEATLEQWQQDWLSKTNIESLEQAPVVALLFYRSHVQSGNTDAFNTLIEMLLIAGLCPLPIAVVSLKDSTCLAMVNELCGRCGVSIILNTTSFAVNAGGGDQTCFMTDAVVLQLIMASNSQQDWEDSSQGLRARDIAMNIALPEMDGRVITRAISFKQVLRHSEFTQIDIIAYCLHQDRAQFVIQLVQRYIALQVTANKEKRIALILANYPTRDGRIGNGVGLDTPASLINILQQMQQQGYPVVNIPADGTALVETLLQGVTNDIDSLDSRKCLQSLPLSTYQQYFAKLPAMNQQAVLARWGAPDVDPKVRNGRIMIPGLRLGLTFVGIQPARGYNLDISATYHDPDLVPPHYYLAFYFWLQHFYAAHAMVHVGKHGNLEWLPGKGVGLAATCWPEIVQGAVPHFYPFIVNDPGEGAQAKRRAQAVVIDHLMPPLTRAETYGPLTEIEQKIDEYYQAFGIDNKRCQYLQQQILTQIDELNLRSELGLSADANDNQALTGLDTYLCELKEAQIRDGLHILGESPRGEQLIDTLLALTRIPRSAPGNQQTGNQHNSLIRALASDFFPDIDFDPLKIEAAETWAFAKPAMLLNVCSSLWRTLGDTRERLELLAKQFIQQSLENMHELIQQLQSMNLLRTLAVMIEINQQVSPTLQACGEAEMRGLMLGLQGKFVPPGPSGAPSRGRLDVLPTGRNFYSVDTRSIPTPTAWQLGKTSAEQVIQRYMQEHGDYPRTIGLSVWGTATMRTGGDDIAQALALMGVQPIWEPLSSRVVDFEIMSNFLLERPRVDVTLRISGFFRDAFPNVVQLFDAAVKALAVHEEPGNTNVIQQNIDADSQRYQQQGLSEEQAFEQAQWRVFGSKPGAYGAGLQGLIDERCWQNDEDLAAAYMNWGSFVYTQQSSGQPAKSVFQDRLQQLEVVLHNQDNREHDILDSDDYYQFQGGMANAVKVYGQQLPVIYHADHSNPSALKIRTLKEELNYVIRSRVVNPKWLAGVRRHGYKGAFEMAATVDYLFAYDATTQLVDDYQYAMVTDAYLRDEKNRAFLEQHNVNAMREMSERLLEAIQRNLWQNPGEYKDFLEDVLLASEDKIERAH